MTRKLIAAVLATSCAMSLAYAFLATYQAYYLIDKIGSAKADVPQQIFLGTLTNSIVVIAASLICGKLSDLTGRRKIFVFTASRRCDVRNRDRQHLQRVPRRHGHRWTRFRNVFGC